MPQNRSNLSSKREKNSSNHIDQLKNDLISKINDSATKKISQRPYTSQVPSRNLFSSQQQDLQVISFEKPEKKQSILQKAKSITTSNRQQIQKAKKALKKSNPEAQGMFLTGTGLYRAEQEQMIPQQNYEEVDMNDALKYLVSHEKDDLQQLRRMINKTSFQIKEYSHQVNKTKNFVVDAADVFGKQINTDLRYKINKHKPLELDFQYQDFTEVTPKRKISTSSKARTKNII